jgi:iron complex transport system substrate-binding protein
MILVIVTIVVGSLLLETVLCASSSESTDYPMMVKDSAGREVTLPTPVERVIVLNTDAAEAVAALGASNAIVGLVEGIKDSYEFRSLQNRTSVGTWTEIDYEMIGEIAR